MEEDIVARMVIRPKCASFDRASESLQSFSPQIVATVDNLKKTSSIARNQGKNPKWTDELLFSLNSALVLSDPMIALSIYDVDARSDNNLFLGQFAFHVSMLKDQFIQTHKHLLSDANGRVMGSIDVEYELEFNNERVQELIVQQEMVNEAMVQLEMENNRLSKGDDQIIDEALQFQKINTADYQKQNSVIKDPLTAEEILRFNKRLASQNLQTSTQNGVKDPTQEKILKEIEELKKTIENQKKEIEDLKEKNAKQSKNQSKCRCF